MIVRNHRASYRKGSSWRLNAPQPWLSLFPLNERQFTQIVIVTRKLLARQVTLQIRQAREARILPEHADPIVYLQQLELDARRLPQLESYLPDISRPRA